MNYVAERLLANDMYHYYLLSVHFEHERIVSALLTQITDGCWTCVDFPCTQCKAVPVSLPVAHMLWDFSSNCLERTIPETAQGTNEVSLANKA